jgi:hypothetical protein
MKLRRRLAAAAGLIFALSFALPAYGGSSGLACLNECWSVLTGFDYEQGGGWLYYSGFVIANGLFVALLAAFFFVTCLRRVRLWISVVAALQVLSWLVLNLIPEMRGQKFDLGVGYFVWLLSYLLLACVHVGIKVAPNQLPEPTLASGAAPAPQEPCHR